MPRTLTLLLGLSFMTMTTSAATPASQPTGASLAFTSDDSVTIQALALMNEGEFAEAQTLLKTGDGHADASVVQAREELKEVIRRRRRDYSVGADAMLRKIQSSIPDATAVDVERWRAQGVLQHRVIDGTIAYFRREPVNLFRFSKDAIARREAAGKAPTGTRFPLNEHLAQVIAEAEKTGKAEVSPIHHRVKFIATIAPDAPGAKAGSLVRCWLPFPQEYRQQRHVKLIRTSPQGATVAPNADGETNITGARQRSVYLEQRLTDPSKPLTFEVEFEYTSYAYYPRLDEKLVSADSGFGEQDRGAGASFEQYLTERPPHIVFTPEIRRAVEQTAGAEPNPLIKARKIFHFIDSEIRYHGEEEYSTIDSFAQKAITRRKGDCGVQAMLFITMCRLAGIPARWQSGWQTKPGEENMHDWSEIYIAPWGWIPVDASNGLQPSDDPTIREFYLGHQDAYRLIVNRDYGSPLVPPKDSFRSEPADFQVGEIEIDGANLFYDDWDYDMDIRTTP
ncbi:MAG TPA: transglutaminase domain-containing protein [Tepidisphaeraceae bacterium]|nr:transglutaminase domain-containing protein [Tepidisphaeraceae bacterium]